MAVAIDSAPGVEVVVLGLAEVQAALDGVDQKAHRALNARVARAVRRVATTAASTVATRATTHRDHDTAAGYRVRGRQGLYSIKNRTRGAAILEFAGKVNPQGNTPQGASLIRTLEQRYGPPGRIAWAAWDAQKDQVTAELVAIVAEAEREIRAAGV